MEYWNQGLSPLAQKTKFSLRIMEFWPWVVKANQIYLQSKG